METPQKDDLTRKPLRLWPGVVIVIVQWLARYVAPAVSNEAYIYGIFGSLICAVLLILWWLFFSRARWWERIVGVVAMIGAVYVSLQFMHISIVNGAMGMLYPIIVVPGVCLAFVLGAALTRWRSPVTRSLTMVVFVVIACLLPWGLIRTGGFSGEGDNDFAWRWSETPEDKLLAKEKNQPLPPPPAPAPKELPKEPVQSAPVETPKESPVTAPEVQTQIQAQVADEPPAVAAAQEAEADWPGFRGPERDSVVRGLKINTDWSSSPPVEIWRRPVGPGWSSFAVDGNLFYTQEQRGEDEVVGCYNTTTGEPVWRHTDPVRFWESNAGAGPRGTPTLSNGRVYSLGATGVVNALNAADGSVVWSRNAAVDTKTKTPGWGYSGSPIVVDDLVIVAASGRIVAYDIADGKLRWLGPEGGQDYSSPHLVNIQGVPQVLFMSRPGTTSFAPANGSVLWSFPLPAATRIVQPAVADGDVVVSEGDRHGMRRLSVQQGPGGWKVKELWTSIGLKPYFSDFVIHNGHAFGFDGGVLACIDLKDGQKKWKGGKYGHGQFVLLADQNVLLVLSEKGDLALVNASTDQFQELAHVPAIKGKTWNHPVVVNDVLLVRNAEEMAGFRLKRAD